MTGDGAFLDAEQGGSGFTCSHPCVYCRCPKVELSAEPEEEYPLNTQKYLNNSSHLPRVWPCSEQAFEAFTCPHCRTKFKDKKSVDRLFDIELSKDKLRDHKSTHGGQCLLNWKLCPLDIESTLIDTMHMMMALVRHQWTHGIAKYIGDVGGDKIAATVNDLLHTKINVTLDVKAVSDNIQNSARAPTLPGAASKLVAEHFELFLKTVLFFENKHLDDTDRQEHHITSSTCMEKLIDLWNALNTPMPLRSGDLPPKQEVKELKAEELDTLALAYRIAYKNAYGKDAFKPYSHMTRHLKDCQLRVQYDLSRYSCQGQEHYGKIMKTLIKGHTNHRLGKNAKGDFAKSYIQQAAEHMLLRKQLNEDVAVKNSAYASKKRQIAAWINVKKEHVKNGTTLPEPSTKLETLRRKQLDAAEETQSTRLHTAKKAQWPKHHVPMSNPKKTEK